MLYEYENRILEAEKLKNEIDQYRPIPKRVIDELREYYRIGTTYSSNALEGNSLTESETKVIIEDGITIGGKTLIEHFEALGHSEAYSLIYGIAEKSAISESDICELHRAFYRRISEDEAGSYRSVAIVISGTDYIPPKTEDLPQLMKGFCDSIADMKVNLHPVEYAASLHIKIATIHPFIDGNGRTARLLMNAALLQCGYPLALIPPLLRADYIETIRQANKGDEAAFINFISSAVYESSKDYLRMLKALLN